MHTGMVLIGKHLGGFYLAVGFESDTQLTSGDHASWANFTLNLTIKTYMYMRAGHLDMWTSEEISGQ